MGGWVGGWVVGLPVAVLEEGPGLFGGRSELRGDGGGGGLEEVDGHVEAYWGGGWVGGWSSFSLCARKVEEDEAF